MDNHWRLEAIHEQFDVFHAIKLPSKTCMVTNIAQINKEIESINKSHLRWPKITEETTKHMCPTIVNKCKQFQINTFEFSFVVIVSNKTDGNQLCKMPLFIIKNGNITTFIDLNCSDYQTWNTFLENNSFSEYQFCFPCDGQYNVGGKLKIDFTESPASTELIAESKLFRWQTLGWMLVSPVVITSSFFFKIEMLTAGAIKALIPVAERFSTDIGKHLHLLSDIVALGGALRAGGPTIVLMRSLVDIVSRFYTYYVDYINEAFVFAEYAMRKAYDYIYKLFKSFFRKASNAEKQHFLAIVSKHDITIRELKYKSEKQMIDAATKPVSIFENCKEECAFSEMKSQTDGDFDSATRYALQISNSVAENLKCETLADGQYVFEGFIMIVIEEYKQQINNYTNSLIAARLASGDNLNVEYYNQHLGIMGNPINHFWEKAIESATKLRGSVQIKEKIAEIKRSRKPIMTALCEKPDDVIGLYVCVGVNVGTAISTDDLLSMIREKEIQLDEDDLQIIETNSSICIKSEWYVIYLHQTVVTTSVSEGLILILSKEDTEN